MQDVWEKELSILLRWQVSVVLRALNLLILQNRLRTSRQVHYSILLHGHRQKQMPSMEERCQWVLLVLSAVSSILLLAVQMQLLLCLMMIIRSARLQNRLSRIMPTVNRYWTRIHIMTMDITLLLNQWTMRTTSILKSEKILQTIVSLLLLKQISGHKMSKHRI